MKKQQKFKTVFSLILLILGVSICTACQWYNQTFDVSFKALLYTIVSPLTGANYGMVFTVLKLCIKPVVMVVAAYFALRFLWTQKTVAVSGTVTVCGKEYKVDFLDLLRRVTALACALAFAYSIVLTERSLQLIDYAKSLLQRTKIYDDYYVDPSTVEITQTSAGKPKNLIYIYMESIETSYASVADGGAQAVNYIPNLTRLVSRGGGTVL